MKTLHELALVTKRLLEAEHPAVQRYNRAASAVRTASDRYYGSSNKDPQHLLAMQAAEKEMNDAARECRSIGHYAPFTSETSDTGESVWPKS